MSGRAFAKGAVLAVDGRDFLHFRRDGLTLLRVMQHIGLRALRGRIITSAVGSALLVVYIGALGELDAEQNARGSNIRDIKDAPWWAAATITTVGYGDHYPVTLAGRLIAAGLMICGIVVLGVVTASFASWLIEQVGKVAAHARAGSWRCAWPTEWVPSWDCPANRD